MPQHPRASREDILDGVVQDVPEREDASDIGRRDNDRERGLCRMRIGMEVATLEPALIPLWFNGGGIVGFCQFGHGEQSSKEARRMQNENQRVIACEKGGPL